MAEVDNSQRGWRQSGYIALASAVVGAAAGKLLDASLAVVLGVLAATLFGALVVTLLWLRREVKDARLRTAAIVAPVAELQARAVDLADRIGKAETAVAGMTGIVEKIWTIATEARDRVAVVELSEQPIWLRVVAAHARKGGWTVSPGFGGGVQFKAPQSEEEAVKEDRSFTLKMPLPDDDAKMATVRKRVEEAVGYVEPSFNFARLLGNQIGAD